MAYSDAQLKDMLSENRWRHYRERDLTIMVGDAVHVVRVLTRVLVNVPREDVDALKTALATYASASNSWGTALNTVTDPRVDDRPQAGQWFAGAVDCRQESIGEEKVPTWNIYQTLYRGAITTAAYAVEKSCRYTVEHIRYLGVQQMITLPATSAGVTYRVTAESFDPDSGGWTIVVEKRTRLYQTQTFESEERADLHEETVQQLGVTSQSVPDIHGADAPAAGELKSQDRTINEDCTKDVVTQKRTAVDQTQTAAEVRADQSSAVTIHTQKSTASLPTTPPVPGAGEVKTVRIEPTEFKDRARTIEETRTAVNQQQEIAEIRADVTVAATVDTQLPDASLPTNPPTPAAGELKSLRIEPTEFKERNRVLQETRTAVDQTQTEATKDAFSSRSTTIHTQKDVASLPTTPPTPGTGETKMVRIEPTEFKDRARTIEVTETATKVEWNYNYTDRDGTVYVWEGRNVTAAEFASAITAASLGSTTQNVVTYAKNPFKDLYDYTIRKHPLLWGLTGTDWTTFETTGLTNVVPQYAYLYDATAKREKRKYRLVTSTYNVRQTNSASTAYSYVSGGKDGSRVETCGQGRYRVFKVTSIAHAAWADDETTHTD